MTYDLHTTIEQAEAALAAAEADCAADFGELAVDAAYADLVESVTMNCTPEVARELCRITGCELRTIFDQSAQLLDGADLSDI